MTIWNKIRRLPNFEPSELKSNEIEAKCMFISTLSSVRALDDLADAQFYCDACGLSSKGSRKFANRRISFYRSISRARVAKSSQAKNSNTRKYLSSDRIHKNKRRIGSNPLRYARARVVRIWHNDLALWFSLDRRCATHRSSTAKKYIRRPDMVSKWANPSTYSYGYCAPPPQWSIICAKCQSEWKRLNLKKKKKNYTCRTEL